MFKVNCLLFLFHATWLLIVYQQINLLFLSGNILVGHQKTQLLTSQTITYIKYSQNSEGDEPPPNGTHKLGIF